MQPDRALMVPPSSLPRSSFSSFLSAPRLEGEPLAAELPDLDSALLPPLGSAKGSMLDLDGTGPVVELGDGSGSDLVQLHEQMDNSLDETSPESIEDAASVMDPLDVSLGAPKIGKGAPASGVLEHWSFEGSDGEGAQLLTDGEGNATSEHTDHHQPSHHELKQPSHHEHHNKHETHDSQGSSLQRHAGQKRQARQKEEHEPSGQQQHHNADSVGDEDVMKNEDREPPVGTIIMSNPEDKGFHVIPVVGGLIAVFGQLYLWGNVFVTLCKPGRSASPPQAPPPTPMPGPAQGPPPQSSLASGASASRFSGASGQPGASARS